LVDPASDPGLGDEPVIAIRSFGAGRLALAVAGAVDPGVVERLRALLDEPLVHEPSTDEMVVNLSEVASVSRTPR
jgi:hypothetical protein